MVNEVYKALDHCSVHKVSVKRQLGYVVYKMTEEQNL